MDKYIKAILAADKRVIIPNFGCIIEPSEEPGTLSFNPYLNFEDGKLSSCVSANERISAEEAVRYIAQKVEQYNDTLNGGGSITIEGVGTFKKGADDRIEFTQVANYHSWDAPNLPMGLGMADPEETLKPAEEENRCDQDDDNEEKEEEEQTISDFDDESDKKKTWPLVLLIILLLLVIIWLLLFVFFKDNAVYRYFMKGQRPATEQVVAPVADSTAVAKDTVEAPVKEPATTKPAKKARPDAKVARALENRYNVIVGSYKDEDIAIKRVDDLHAKGYTDAFVGIRKDYFVAVIKDFTSITEAEAYQEEIVDGRYHIESWITNSGENGR